MIVREREKERERERFCLDLQTALHQGIMGEE
jgi:hypothetical protein